jgi:hypothetical protein
MPLDLAAELAQALQDPRVGSALAEHIRPVVRGVLAEREADVWLTARESATYLYGCEGREDAFRKLRERHPDLDRLSVGKSRLRRWKRADLDKFLSGDPRSQRRRAKAQ